MKHKPTVCFDFDGVIHSYTSGWKGVECIPDPPVPGIGEAIEDLMNSGYRVVVVSARCTSLNGVEAIYDWLEKHDIQVDDVMSGKPPAIVYIDDRGLQFDGDASTLVSKVKNFKTWMEK